MAKKTVKLIKKPKAMPDKESMMPVRSYVDYMPGMMELEHGAEKPEHAPVEKPSLEKAARKGYDGSDTMELTDEEKRYLKRMRNR